MYTNELSETETPEPVVDVLRTMSEEERYLRNMRKAIRTIERLTENEPSNNIYKIKQELMKIEKILKQTRLTDLIEEDVEQRIRPVKSEMPEWEEQANRSFGQRLEDALKQVEFELSGNYPLLKVLFYTLEVKLYNNNVTIWYGPQQERLDTCKPIPEVVAKKLLASHKKITSRNFDDEIFLLHLYEAYKATAHRSKKTIGDSIPVSDIILEYALLTQNKNFKINPVKSSYREYGRVFFSYDLYQLKQRTIEDGFDFLGFYFVEAYPEDRFRGNIHIIPTEGSVQRVIRNIIEATEIKSEMVSPGLVIKRIYKVIDAWLNYYHHTDYLKGTEKIQECFNERIQVYIREYQQEKLVGMI